MKDWNPKEIKELRIRYKFKQHELANLLGVSRQYIVYLEKGVRTSGKPLRLLLDCVEEKLKEKGGNFTNGAEGS